MSIETHFCPCMLCGKAGHRVSNCTEIGIPPYGDFFRPSSSGGCDDDEDEAIYFEKLQKSYQMWLRKVIKLRRMSRNC